MPPTALPLDFLDTPADEVAARFRWARERGHPRYVWPDVPIPVWRAGLEAIAEATAGVLGSDGVGESPSVELELPEGVDARSLGVAANTAGMGPLLGLWIERGRLVADDEVTALLSLHLEHGRLRAKRTGALLEDLGARFESAGIPLTLLKGIHTGLVYYPEPGTRPAVDIDLAVSPHDLVGAEAVLSGAGYALRERYRGPTRSEWLPPNSTTSIASLDLAHADNPLDVDLHAGCARRVAGIRTIDFSPSGSHDLVTVDEVGSPRALAPPLLALMIAVHASEEFEGLKLIRMVDLVLLAAAARPSELFDEALVDRARSLGVLRFAYPLVALAQQLVPGTVGQAFLEAARRDASRRMRERVDGLTPGTAQAIKGHDLTDLFLAARGPVEHARRLAHLALPLAGAGLAPKDIVSFYHRRWSALARRFRRD